MKSSRVGRASRTLACRGCGPPRPAAVAAECGAGVVLVISRCTRDLQARGGLVTVTWRRRPGRALGAVRRHESFGGLAASTGHRLDHRNRPYLRRVYSESILSVMSVPGQVWLAPTGATPSPGAGR